MEEIKNNNTGTLPEFTPSERKETIKSLEKVVGLPYSQIKSFLEENYCDLLNSTGKNSHKVKRPTKKKASDLAEFPYDSDKEQDIYESDEYDVEKSFEKDTNIFMKQSSWMRPSNAKQEMLIYDIFRHSDNDLRELAQLLVVWILGYFLKQKIRRYARKPEEVAEYVQIAMIIISEEMPKYDPTYKMTTFLERPLEGAFTREFNKRSNTAFASRYEAESNLTINKYKKEYCVERGIDPDSEINPMSLKAYIDQKGPKKKLSIRTIDKCLKGYEKIVSMETGVDQYVSSSEYDDPESAMLKKEQLERFNRTVEKLPALEKATIKVCLELIKEEKKFPKTVICRKIKKQFPNAKEIEIEKAYTTATSKLRDEFSRKEEKKNDFFESLLEPSDFSIEDEAEEFVEMMELMDLPNNLL